MLLYRIGNSAYRLQMPFIPGLCNALIRVIHRCVVYSETSIGAHTDIGYGGIAVVIHKRAEIGGMCVIGPHVVIGGRSRKAGVPRIGDRVYVGAGAKILGDISIGDDCVIGANAVVLDSVPAGCMVVGVPAKIVRKNIRSADYY